MPWYILFLTIARCAGGAVALATQAEIFTASLENLEDGDFFFFP